VREPHFEIAVFSATEYLPEENGNGGCSGPARHRLYVWCSDRNGDLAGTYVGDDESGRALIDESRAHGGALSAGGVEGGMITDPRAAGALLFPL
jgi:hypothetical protein